MTSKGGDILEQAKKRDHKIVITDVAIEKVPYIEVTGLSNDVCKAIQDEHKEILRIAKAKNDSNEVLTIMTADGLEKIRIFGDEFEVNPSNEPKAIVIFNQAKRREIMYLHNHPSTNSFSLADINNLISIHEVNTPDDNSKRTSKLEFEYIVNSSYTLILFD